MSKTYEANQERSQRANDAFNAFMAAYADAIGEHPTKDDPETAAARAVATEEFGYMIAYPATEAQARRHLRRHSRQV